MSVSLKKAAKKLRRLFGVADGVQSAKYDPIFGRPGCEVVVAIEAETLDEQLCPEFAHVIEDGKGMCKPHMKAAHKRKHDQKISEPYKANTPITVAQTHVFPEDDNNKLHKTAATLAAAARTSVRVSR
jgi:hypothetical protein